MEMSPSIGWCKTLTALTYHRMGALVICRMISQSVVWGKTTTKNKPGRRRVPSAGYRHSRRVRDGFKVAGGGGCQPPAIRRKSRQSARLLPQRGRFGRLYGLAYAVFPVDPGCPSPLAEPMADRRFLGFLLPLAATSTIFSRQSLPGPSAGQWNWVKRLQVTYGLRETTGHIRALVANLA
jgi:hypothetical protein